MLAERARQYPCKDSLQTHLVRSLGLLMLDFQRSARRGERAGTELNCHLMEGRADIFRQLWFLEQPDPRKPHRKVPSKTVVLVRIRFSCYNKGPNMRVADRNLHLSPAHSGGRESKVSRVAPGSSSPRCSVILGELPSFTGPKMQLQLQSSGS